MCVWMKDYFQRDTGPGQGEASTLINQDGSWVGMLAITHCEGAFWMAQLAQTVTRPKSEACCSQMYSPSPCGDQEDTSVP